MKSKLHSARVTATELWYEGSCAIDEDLVKAANMVKNERIDVYNVTNGQRFSTYIILAAPGSGTVSMNGACARLVEIGDKVIIASYGQFKLTEAENFEPSVILIGEDNVRK